MIKLCLSILSLGGLGLAASLGSRATAAIEPLEPKYFKDVGAKRVLMKYGPLKVPAVSDPVTAGMKEFSRISVEMPCRNCYLTGYQGGLEFVNGSNANANTGMWLHHIVYMNLNRSDINCPKWPDRFGGSGNERTPVDLTVGGTRKLGYFIGEKDMIISTAELMNEADDEREVYITSEWEFVPGDTPGFANSTSLWVDITGQCANSSVTVPSKPVFEASASPEWTIDFSGEIVGGWGHLHDGGINLEVLINGKVVCNHVASYGESPEYVTHVGMFGRKQDKDKGEAPGHDEHGGHSGGEVAQHDHGDEPGDHGEEPGDHHGEEPGDHHGEEPGDHHGEEPGDHHGDEPGDHHGDEPGEEAGPHDHATGDHITHISSMTLCGNIGMVKPGDKIGIKAYYNMTAHPAMAGHHGGLEPVMGISLLNLVKAP